MRRREFVAGFCGVAASRAWRGPSRRQRPWSDSEVREKIEDFSPRIIFILSKSWRALMSPPARAFTLPQSGRQATR